MRQHPVNNIPVLADNTGERWFSSIAIGPADQALDFRIESALVFKR
jgi:hypothetical protein